MPAQLLSLPDPLTETTDELNERAFRQSKPQLDASFPAGHFIAFNGGQIIADASTIQELRPILIRAGKNPSEVFVVQAGVEYPQFTTILFCAVGRESCDA